MRQKHWAEYATWPGCPHFPQVSRPTVKNLVGKSPRPREVGAGRRFRIGLVPEIECLGRGAGLDHGAELLRDIAERRAGGLAAAEADAFDAVTERRQGRAGLAGAVEHGRNLDLGKI